MLVSVQTRPVRREAEGRLVTVSPNERARARQVLVPLATRDSPSPARFVRVPAGEDRRLFWGTVPGLLTVRLRLLCLRTTPEPEELAMALEGDPVTGLVWKPKCGESRLSLGEDLSRATTVAEVRVRPVYDDSPDSTIVGKGKGLSYSTAV
ncbi:MAG TPA: hypothetical protein DCM87_03930, partial [Planctomycetes bacterium]|nr:hypothetical protein [Planctomycetota bacterium]